MAINLIKGQRVEIEAGLTRLKVEMGWKVNAKCKSRIRLGCLYFPVG